MHESIVVKSIKLLGLVAVAILFAQGVRGQQNGAQDQKYVLFGKKERSTPADNNRVVRGRVTDKDGKPVSEAIVEALAPGGKPESAATDEQGNYSIAGLKLTSDYEVKARKEGLAPATRKLSQYDSRKEVFLNFSLRPDRQRPSAAKNESK